MESELPPRHVIENKTALVRVGYDVKVKDGKVVDNNRIKASLETIKYLRKYNCTVVLIAHLGRPKGTVMEKYSLKPVFEELKKLLPKEKMKFISHCVGSDVQKQIFQDKKNKIFLLENLRFYEEEEENDIVFAQSLAKLGNVYVDDAFSNAHRNHASMTAITRFLPSYWGFDFEKEVRELSKVLNPRTPAAWIVGGVKLGKIQVKGLQKADKVLVGGALGLAFLKAEGISIGMSKIDSESVNIAKKMLKRKLIKKIVFPVDYVVADSFSARANTKVVEYNKIGNNQIALDIGPKTIELFKRHLRGVHTIFWNGPLGYFEWAKFAVGTKEIGRFIGSLTATTICGGGETSSALRKFHLDHKMNHVSNAGGATLSFIGGEKLPALIALERNRHLFS